MPVSTVDRERSLGITCPFTRTKENIRRSFKDQAEYRGSTVRLRLTPGGIHQPAIVGIVCFLVTFVIVLAILEFGHRVGECWDLSILIKAVVGVIIAVPVGIYDYFYTRRGHDRGRWDLIVDRLTGELQLPAVSAYGEPHQIRIKEVIKLEVVTMIEPDDDDGTPGTYGLNTICSNNQKNKRYQNDSAQRMEYTVAQCDSEAQMVALGEWLSDAAQLGISVGRANFRGSLRKRLIELTSTSREVDPKSRA